MSELGLLIGTGAQVGASLYRGNAARASGEYNANLSRQQGQFDAAQLERQATEERVAGQRAAFERQHQINQTVSTQRAVAAASGAGGVETPGLYDIIGDTIARGEYLKGTDRYLAEERARGKEDQAAASRAKGNNAANLYETQGNNAFVGSILDSVGTAGKGYFEWNKNYGGRKTAAYDPRRSDTTVRYG